MSKQLTALLVVVFFLACLGLTAVLPLAELGVVSPEPPTDLPSWIPAFVTQGPVAEFGRSVGDSVAQMIKGLKEDPNFSYYVYSVYLGLAMTAAAIAIAAVGREEAEEKTVLPIKK